jgi:regulator of cell morphogenesis and NO signaling
MRADEVTLETIVNAITRERPELLGPLVGMGIEACCGGALSLGDAARDAGRDPEEVLSAVRKALTEPASV